MGVAEVTFERLSNAYRRSSDSIVDQPHRLCAGFGGERHRQLQADLGLRRQQLPASLDIIMDKFGGAGNRVARRLDPSSRLAHQELRQLLVACHSVTPHNAGGSSCSPSAGVMSVHAKSSPVNSSGSPVARASA